MSHYSNLEDDEIDLSELFGVLWSHKLLIALVTGLSIFLAGYNVITTEKKFTAKSVFQIEQMDGSSSFNLSSELGALASLAGFSNTETSSSTDILLERVKGREFIIDMKTKFLIDRDKYFNTYNPNYKDPFWKATIKKIIGWQTTELEKNAIIENNVLRNYRKNVLFEVTDGGAIAISVTHIDPKKASYYANILWKKFDIWLKRKAMRRKSYGSIIFQKLWPMRFKTWKKPKKTLKTMLLKIVRWLRKISFQQPETQRNSNGTAKSPRNRNLLSVIEKFIDPVI